MTLSKFGALCVGGAALPLLVIAASALRDMGAFRWSISDEAAALKPAETVGGKRNSYLAELTRSYVTQPGVSTTDAMRKGRELAPIPFLNEELERRGVKWRVRTTIGLDTTTYDVS